MGSSGQPTIGLLPFAASKANLNFATRTVDSAQLGMGYLEGNQTQNAYVEWDVWLDAGTWKYAHTALDYTDVGIYTVQLDGVTVGTIDGYNAALTRNVYKEITGITVATAKVYTLKIIMATKNASSSSYGPRLSSIALIKTAGAHSTPAGSDTPGYTWQFLPFMGYKAIGGGWSDDNVQSSAYLGGGYKHNGNIQNSYIEWDVWLDAGTYKFALIHVKNTNVGIYDVQLNGVSQGTIDGYDAAGPTNNTYSELTGLTVATAGVKTLKILMATKNASSSAYRANLQSIAFVRTGA